ncbi:MAG: RagB/SusD family nutrient uptake outer membrane protein [Muribaculaceae bacterium]|nr:RagB/SusD family nutrient uptake outer membrane protein [Muribaculaceae bacterium]
MKYINRILATVIAGVALTGCNDLDTEYLGYYVTEDQKADVLESNPEMALAGVTGIAATGNMYGSVYDDAHFDFGYPAIMLGLDMQGNDMLQPDVSYGVHFNYWYRYTSPTNTGIPTNMMWRIMYKMIFSSNAVLSTISSDTENETLQFYRAQALGFRAFCYWNLIQTYQFNYVGNESAAGVPIITEENQLEAATNGCARNTVQEVYDRILDDLNEAVTLSQASGLTAEQLMESKPKRLLNIDALYGLRARVYLTMHKYAEAANDARSAIQASTHTPLTIAQASVPGFNDISANNWMWGVAVAETDRVVTTGICNFPSMSCSFAYGYITVGAWKIGSRNMVEALPLTDVRRGWFLDENFESPILTDRQTAYLQSYGTSGSDTSIYPYLNVKFDSYQSILSQSTNASDIPLMRIEEMYYILAEGLAMSGNTTEALSVLTDFETKYRNPEFSTRATTPAEIQELVYSRRRVELWGEGLSYFDLQRLNKTIDRRNDNFPDAVTYVIPANDDIRIYVIPQRETTANKLISVDEANPAGVSPLPQK